MATFWTWAVRNPCALVAALALAAGFTEVLEWSAALMLTMVAAVMADAAQHLGSKARKRAGRARAASEALQAAVALRKRIIDSEPKDLRRAA
jgi:hypothetical protein